MSNTEMISSDFNAKKKKKKWFGCYIASPILSLYWVPCAIQLCWIAALFSASNKKNKIIYIYVNTLSICHTSVETDAIMQHNMLGMINESGCNSQLMVVTYGQHSRSDWPTDSLHEWIPYFSVLCFPLKVGSPAMETWKIMATALLGSIQDPFYYCCCHLHKNQIETDQ